MEPIDRRDAIPSRREDTAQAVVGAAAAVAGGGALTFALFPLLLPAVVLVGVLALPLLPLALVGALLGGAFVVVRGTLRDVKRAGPLSL
jgi:hypothetical protein